MISSPTVRKRLALAAVLVTGAVAAKAQTASNTPTSDEVIELSPYTVNASEDKGYQAQNMLAGSRLKSELKDIANPVTAFTEQFFLDTGITDTNELQNYMLSTETQFNEDAGSTGANQNNLGTGNARGVRVRGLNGGANTTNFFATGGVGDTFSTERVEQARGPNALLFGIGNAGGVVNLTTKRARHDRTKTSLGVAVHSYDGNRMDFDHNQVLIRKKLAIRVAGVRSRTNSWRAWDFRNTEGIFATAKLQITKDTELNVEGERMHIRRHTSRTFTAFDGYTLWRDAGRQVVADSATSAQLTAAQVGNITASPNSRFIYTTNTGTFANWVGKRQSNSRVLTGTTNNHPLLDFSVLPPEAVFAGPGNEQVVETSRISAYLTHSVGRNFNMELAAMRLSEHRDIVDPQQDISQYIRADPNLTLPGGAPNPFAGEDWAYMEGMPTHDFAEERTDFVRVSANYRFDLGRFGNHLLAGVAEHDKQHSDRGSLRQYIISRNAPTARAGNISAAADNNRVFQRTYFRLGSPVEQMVQANPKEVPTGTFISQGGTSAGQNSTGQPYTTAYIPFDANTRFLGYDLTTLMGMVQSSWLNNRLRTVVGMTRDQRMSYQSQQIFVPIPDGNGGIAVPVAGGAGSDLAATNLSASAVLRVNKWVNLTYSRSKNSGLPSNAGLLHSPTGRPPVSEGNSQDMGVKVSMLDNKIVFTAVYFQTSADKDNQTGGIIGNGEINEIWGTLSTLGIIDPETGSIIESNKERSNAATFSSRTQGYEFEMTANLKPNWRTMMNYSNMTTVRTNFAPEMMTYLTDVAIPFWLQPQFANLELTSGSGQSIIDPTRRPTIAEQAAIIFLTARENQQANEGRTPLGQRKHKFNFRTSYDFEKGWTKGIGIGAGARYQSAPIIGFVANILPDGSIERNITRGADSLAFDANISYGRKMRMFGRQLNWTLQLNVDNVLDNNPIYTTTRILESGRVSMYRFREPRYWKLSYRVNF